LENHESNGDEDKVDERNVHVSIRKTGFIAIRNSVTGSAASTVL